MLKTIFSNILFLTICIAAAVLAHAMLQALGDGLSFLLFAIINFYIIVISVKQVFGTKKNFLNEINIFIMACVITSLLAWGMFEALGVYALLLIFIITNGMLFINYRNAKSDIKESSAFEKRKSAGFSKMQAMLSYMLIFGACIALLGMIGLRIKTYIG